MRYKQTKATSTLTRLGGFLALSLFALSVPAMTATAQSSVWSWGSNTYGELGDNSTAQRTTPVQVKGAGNNGFLADVVAVAGGANHSVVLKSDHTVFAWGWNFYGQMGTGFSSHTVYKTPLQVKGPGGAGNLTDVIAITSGDSHSLAIKTDHTVFAWGWNASGQIGDGTANQANAPTPVKGLNGSGKLSDVVAISSSSNTNLALKSDGTVWGWGANGNGQVGDGSTTDRKTPVQVSGLTNVVAIAAGNTHSLALAADGSVWAWGSNGYGELGDNSNTQRTTPVRVLDPADATGNLTGVTAVAAGGNFSTALKKDATVWSWGRGDVGALGNGANGHSKTPVQVKSPDGAGTLNDITAIACGQFHVIALRTDGSVRGWGGNGSGQLGDASNSNRNLPVQAGTLIGMTRIGAALNHSLTLMNGLSISGTVTLEGCADTVHPITFEFRPTDGSGTFTRTSLLTATGAFVLNNLPAKSYNVWIKGEHWLAKVISIDATGGSVAGVTTLLSGGDVNNDNKVNLDDLGILAGAFDTVPGDADWDPRADLTCDNVCSLDDLGLLSLHFDEDGDL